MPSKICVLLLVLVVYLFDQVYSFKCYECESYSRGKCWNNPKQPEFERTCDIEEELELYNAIQPGVVSSLNNLISSATLARNSKNNLIQFDCGTLQVSFLGSKGAIRSCFPSIISCEDLESMFVKFGMKVEQCSRCREDLCNSEKLL